MRKKLASFLRWLAKNGDMLKRLADKCDPPTSNAGGGSGEGEGP